jgi:hypothetical protein
MKNMFSCFLLMLIVSNALAQLKVTPQCPGMLVNIAEGNVNDIYPNFTFGQIETKFPCFTSEEPESDTSKCGGLIAYSDLDIYFYTSRDYIEIREKFKGKMSLPLMGASRDKLFQWLGYPKIKDIKWDAFQTAYGLLILYYNQENKINKIQMSTRKAESLKLCD